MELKRQQIIAYALKYQGEYAQVLKAISAQEAYENPGNLAAITIVDDDYPANFWLLRYPPLCLFYLGDRTLLQDKLVAIVGSRQASDESLELTKIIVKNLKNDYDIVSGLARGIDGCSHRAALACGKKTIGILANGINFCYPQEHRDLYRTMTQEHLVLSEYPGLTAPLRNHFPFRNRLIAALAAKLIIPAAQRRSGTMITVDIALELNKDVYCVKLNNKEERGSEYLIEQGANLLESIAQIREL